MEELIAGIVKGAFRLILSLFDGGLISLVLVDNKWVTALGLMFIFFLIGFFWIVFFGISDFPGYDNWADALLLEGVLTAISLAIFIFGILYEKNRKKEKKE